MVFDVAAEFNRIDSALAAWVAASGQPTPVELAMVEAFDADAPDRSADRPSPHLAAIRLGWREGRRTGRFATERELIADYLVTATAPSLAAADAILARLAACTAEGLQDIAPVPPASSLWPSLRLVPRPALTVAAPFRLTAGEPAAPQVRAVDARIGHATALEGRVMRNGAGVARARVGTAGDGRWVRTDQEGRFVLANWSGQPVTVEHRRTRQSFTPTEQRDADVRDLVLTLPAEE